jgi:hypothetical protein
MYRVVRRTEHGMIFWHVLLGKQFVRRFSLKRIAIDWVMAQEKK